MKLVIELDPSEITFTSVGSDGPYPYLVAVSSLHMEARTGDGSAQENQSVTVSLMNDQKRAATILDVPLRKRVRILFDDDTEFFAGIVASVAYGNTVDLSIES